MTIARMLLGSASDQSHMERIVKKPDVPSVIYMALKPDPNGGWGGPPYWQVVPCSFPGAVAFVPRDAT